MHISQCNMVISGVNGHKGAHSSKNRRNQILTVLHNGTGLVWGMSLGESQTDWTYVLFLNHPGVKSSNLLMLTHVFFFF